MDLFLVLLLSWIGGFLFGCYVHKKIYKLFLDGNLVVDISDEDGPYLFLDLSKTVEEIQRQETVQFSVKIRREASPK
ncbi:MAG: hypothetical protein Q4C65_02650 [Eubacteriales bacterium]|nr:hypothetical protein [Eubacteriales bacterium]